MTFVVYLGYRPGDIEYVPAWVATVSLPGVRVSMVDPRREQLSEMIGVAYDVGSITVVGAPHQGRIQAYFSDEEARESFIALVCVKYEVEIIDRSYNSEG